MILVTHYYEEPRDAVLELLEARNIRGIFRLEEEDLVSGFGDYDSDSDSRTTTSGRSSHEEEKFMLAND